MNHHLFSFALCFSVLVVTCSCTTEADLPISDQECYQLNNGTHLPRLSVTPDNLLLSYVYSSTDGDSLMLTKPAAERMRDFSIPVDYGKDWFVNWADYPSVAYVSDGPHGDVLFYHYLKYSAEGTYDYDVMYNLLDGGGPFWEAKKLHQDTVSAEHGFLSSAALPGGGLQVSWLDGRYTKTGAVAGAEPVEEAGEEHGHGTGGAMTLRTKALSDSASVELDHRVCDCCNTATIATDSLVMVAYRDRSEHEMRDISYVVKRMGAEAWSTPKTVHADNWEISGCPVNGPALAAAGPENIAIVWYTAPADRALINFSRYDAPTDQWQAPIVLDDAAPLGRVDLQLAPDGTAYATGLTRNNTPDLANLTLWTITPDNKVSREILSVCSTGRSSGFPKISLYDGKLYWARTVVGESRKDHHVEVCWQ